MGLEGGLGWGWKGVSIKKPRREISALELCSEVRLPQ